MVAVTTSSNIESSSFSLAKTSSVDAAYSDPDLLIREYFLSSLAQRARSRPVVAQHIKGVEAVFAILSRGASGNARDGFDGAVNLLAEINDLDVLTSACRAVKTYYPQMYANLSTRVFAERFLEILIKAIACAYKINANQRLGLLKHILTLANNRVTAASLIDALGIIADELDVNLVRDILEKFTHNSDQYIRNHALEALQEID